MDDAMNETMVEAALIKLPCPPRVPADYWELRELSFNWTAPTVETDEAATIPPPRRS